MASSLLRQNFNLVTNQIPDAEVRKCAKQYAQLLLTGKQPDAIDNIKLAHLNKDQLAKLVDIIDILSRLEKVSGVQAAALQKTNQKPVANLVIDTANGMEDTPENLALVIRHIASAYNITEFTTHPTFLTISDYEKRLNKAFDAISKNQPEKAKQHLSAVLENTYDPSIKENLSSDLEGDVGLEILMRAFKYLPDVYAPLDKFLKLRFPESYTDRSQLSLNLIFESWAGSFDKDGNVNVTAAGTAALITKKRTLQAALYLHAIPATEEALRQKLEKLKNLDPYKNESEFTTQLQAELEQYFLSKDDVANYRRVRTFGLSLGGGEYRDTAEELDHVFDCIFGDYSGRDEHIKHKFLEEAINHPKKLRKIIEAKLQEVPEEAKAKDYKYADTGSTNYAIFYNTIMRAKLMKKNPDIFKGQQVLAECETPLQYKQCLAIYKALGLEKQIKIVPLFEKPHVISKPRKLAESFFSDSVIYKSMVRQSLAAFKQNPLFKLPRKLKEAIKDLDPSKGSFKKDVKKIDKAIHKITHEQYTLQSILSMQFQVAHSDNTRRGGPAGTRMMLENVHRVFAEVGGEFGIGVEFFQGGSRTDPMRGGARSVTAALNVIDTNPSKDRSFVKWTVQGRDMFAYLANAQTFAMYYTEMLSHQIKNSEFWNGIEYKPSKKRTAANFHLSASPVQQIINEAIASFESYKQDFFQNKSAIKFMNTVLEAAFVIAHTNKGSRAKSRKAGDTALVNPDDIRSIPFTQMHNFMQCNISFMGYSRISSSLFRKIEAETNKLSTETDLSHEHKLHFAKFSKTETLEDGDFAHTGCKERAEVLNALYKTSPGFKDATDRAADAIARADIPYILKQAHATGDQEVIEFAKKLERDYRASARAVIRAISGEKSGITEVDSLDDIRNLVRNHMRERESIKNADFGIRLLRRVREAFGDKFPENATRYYNAMGALTMQRPSFAPELEANILHKHAA